MALVVAYHLAPSAVPGGFLGVDVFFVLSGFLITSLLLDEARSDRSVRLGRFYVRRVRRLAPALLLLLLAGAIYAWVAATPAELSRVREHSLWTLGYLANWRFIADGTTYTDLVVGQSPLRHTWSLAIEEQFYVVFPLIVVGLGRWTNWSFERLRRAVMVMAVGGTVVSAAWMAMLWSGVDGSSRGYFGTDTRAHSLLVGVALGAVLLGRPPRTGRAGLAAAVAGLVGAPILIVAVAISDETSSALQHGGFLLVALAVAGVISALERAEWLRSALSLRPLVALGVISYGVYLWHWPIIVVVDEARTGLSGVALGVLRLALTLAAASASYALVERPIRQGVLGRRAGPLSLAAFPAAVIAVVVVVLAATVVPGRPKVSSSAAPPTIPVPVVTAVPLPVGALVFGDSVAHTIAGGTVGAFPEFDPWTSAQSSFDPALVEAWSVAKPACSFLPGGTIGAGPGSADLSGFCGDWRGDVERALVEHSSTVVLVALNNDASSRSIEGEEVVLGTPAHAALVAGLLDDLREIAQRHGADVVLVALPPRVGAAASALDEGGLAASLMREELERYAATRPAVRVLDLFDRVCPAGDCDRPAAGFDPEWRYDGMHYSPEGARWVAGWLTQQLTTGP